MQKIVAHDKQERMIFHEKEYFCFSFESSSLIIFYVGSNSNTNTCCKV